MKVFLDCIPCFLKQALAASKLATSDKVIQEKAIREVLKQLSSVSFDTSPPHIGQIVHNIVKEITQNSDPYAKLKKKSNDIAMKLYSSLKTRLDKATDPFKLSLCTALAGNMIDFGARPGEEIDIEKEIEQALNIPLDKGVIEYFKEVVLNAQKILYLGDNAGEIVFDKLLISTIGPEKITFVVKKSPIINDATYEDAHYVGLTDLVDVIDNGSDYPGTVLDDCSEKFLELYNKCDIVIAKGQGNYETLSDEKRQIVFLLKVKCPVIAKDLNRSIGDVVVHFHNI